MHGLTGLRYLVTWITRCVDTRDAFVHARRFNAIIISLSACDPAVVSTSSGMQQLNPSSNADIHSSNTTPTSTPALCNTNGHTQAVALVECGSTAEAIAILPAEDTKEESHVVPVESVDALATWVQLIVGNTADAASIVITVPPNMSLNGKGFKGIRCFSP